MRNKVKKRFSEVIVFIIMLVLLSTSIRMSSAWADSAYSNRTNYTNIPSTPNYFLYASNGTVFHDIDSNSITETCYVEPVTSSSLYWDNSDLNMSIQNETAQGYLVCTNSSGGAYTSGSAPSKLIAFLPMDNDPTSIVTDFSGHEYNGSLTQDGGAPYQQGYNTVFNKGVYLNATGTGATSYSDGGTLSIGFQKCPTNFTISMWLNTSTATKSQVIFNKN